MNKKILIFSLTYFPYVGGAEVATKEITDRIDEKDISFDMVSLRFDKNLPKNEKVGNVNVYRLGPTEDTPEVSDKVSVKLKIAKIIFPFLAFWKARELQKKNNYDVIWVMMLNHGAFGALMFKWLFPKIPYLLTLQDGQTVKEIVRKNPLSRIVLSWYKKIFTKADMIQVISSFLKQIAVEMGTNAPIVIVPNGVNVKHFSQNYSDEILNKLRDRLKLQKSKRYMVTTSRLVPKNGIEYVVRAIEYLPKYVNFLIIGSGHKREAIEKIAEEIKVADRIHFLGQISYNELPKYLKISDIFIRPSIVEGFGNSFVEAMASEIPVIATPVGGIVDFLYDPDKNLDHEPTGLFCGVRDPQGVAVQVRKILDDKKLANKLVKNASKMVIERYDWDKVAKDMQTKVFEKII